MVARQDTGAGAAGARCKATNASGRTRPLGAGGFGSLPFPAPLCSILKAPQPPNK